MKKSFVGFVVVLAALIYFTFGEIILTLGDAVINPIINLGL